jgi:hypothetical protein
MMEPLEQMREWGYDVQQSQEVEGVPIWHIGGHGMTTYVRDDDAEGLATLSDPEAHEARVAWENMTDEERAAALQEQMNG